MYDELARAIHEAGGEWVALPPGQLAGRDAMAKAETMRNGARQLGWRIQTETIGGLKARYRGPWEGATGQRATPVARGGQQGRKLSPVVVARIHELRATGLSLAKISKDPYVNCSLGTVRQYVRRAEAAKPAEGADGGQWEGIKILEETASA